ncbi:hypothetical protein Enr13x_59370 [Stieleria neptunia]|uniref:Uncharacterized protein n=1 Tax=Stieleria neptunia TaxID=2527979 RepID=A0A518HYW0_9BACT|nr:hypothetical protein Enr13x_59370 [Stieleria neptunia]
MNVFRYPLLFFMSGTARAVYRFSGIGRVNGEPLAVRPRAGAWMPGRLRVAAHSLNRQPASRPVYQAVFKRNRYARNAIGTRMTAQGITATAKRTNPVAIWTMDRVEPPQTAAIRSVNVGAAGGW